MQSNTNVQFRDLSVTNISMSSSILIGVNLHVNVKTMQKNNMGYGITSGNHIVSLYGTSIVYDPDLIDSVFKSKS
ncbi:hypothetical protein [Rossellomorea sp. BNER]|jgi:hypothetical protein|uniref:hypothetical protein n=1 Tax=Rossellomorea sp. BNER TaxID=2962031 RepID=UPI003AF30D25|nr:hypothetical protein [Rossellomorea sp. BNER]